MPAWTHRVGRRRARTGVKGFPAHTARGRQNTFQTIKEIFWNIFRINGEQEFAESLDCDWWTPESHQGVQEILSDLLPGCDAVHRSDRCAGRRGFRRKVRRESSKSSHDGFLEIRPIKILFSLRDFAKEIGSHCTVKKCKQMAQKTDINDSLI